MLGDGLAALVKSDGSVVSLSENKTQGFSNITTALSANVSAKDWQYLSLSAEQCIAVLLCTDGVADDLDNADGFVSSFVEAHRTLASVAPTGASTRCSKTGLRPSTATIKPSPACAVRRWHE